MSSSDKKWNLPLSGKKKFFATLFFHCLFGVIDKKIFDIVFEGFIDQLDINSEQPDLVVHDKKSGFKPVVLVEFCSKDNENDVLKTAKIMCHIYGIPESFIYNLESKKWYKFSRAGEEESVASYSDFIEINLNRILQDSLKYYAS
ncbi:MAG: hypothetical protein ABI855_04570 [Bacteroidota bacterium]